MTAEHAHLDMNYGIVEQPRVSFEHHIKQIAKKAMSQIPGAQEIIEETFNRGKQWEKPFALPAKRAINQAYHLGF